jgi:ribulose-phosphate 3-epimerase
MSVNPGFGGQQFIKSTLTKIERLKQMIIAANASTLIEVDGGVTLDNAKAIINAGADVLVAGNTVFNAAFPSDAIKMLKNL